MSRADYAHWNEDAGWIWWQEEGRWPNEPDGEYDGPIGEPSGAQMDYDDAYDEGYAAAENGEPRDNAPDGRTHDAWLQGYDDGAVIIEDDDEE